MSVEGQKVSVNNLMSMPVTLLKSYRSLLWKEFYKNQPVIQVKLDRWSLCTEKGTRYDNYLFM